MLLKCNIDHQEFLNIDEIDHITKDLYLDEINHTVEINRMNKIPFFADEIHHLRLDPE